MVDFADGKLVLTASTLSTMFLFSHPFCRFSSDFIFPQELAIKQLFSCLSKLSIFGDFYDSNKYRLIRQNTAICRFRRLDLGLAGAREKLSDEKFF